MILYKIQLFISEKSALSDVYPSVKLILIIKALAVTLVTMPSSVPHYTSQRGLGARSFPLCINVRYAPECAPSCILYTVQVQYTEIMYGYTLYSRMIN